MVTLLQAFLELKPLFESGSFVMLVMVYGKLLMLEKELRSEHKELKKRLTTIERDLGYEQNT